MPHPDLIIFDCDGVLADSEILSAEVLIGELRALGVCIDAAYVERHCIGRSFPTVVQELGTRHGVTLPGGFEEACRTRLLARFETELRPTPGVIDCLAALEVPACVATSSSPRRVARTLALLGLAGRFGTAVFTASEVARGKPAPDLFLHAAARMGVAPDRTLVVEDSVPGLEAARAAGAMVLAYRGGAHLRAESRRAVPGLDVTCFDDWRVFPALLEEMGAGIGA